MSRINKIIKLLTEEMIKVRNIESNLDKNDENAYGLLYEIGKIHHRLGIIEQRLGINNKDIEDEMG